MASSVSRAGIPATLLPNRLFPFPVAVGSNDLALYWHEASDADPAAAWLRELAMRHFSTAVG